MNSTHSDLSDNDTETRAKLTKFQKITEYMIEYTEEIRTNFEFNRVPRQRPLGFRVRSVGYYGGVCSVSPSLSLSNFLGL